MKKLLIMLAAVFTFGIASAQTDTTHTRSGKLKVHKAPVDRTKITPEQRKDTANAIERNKRKDVKMNSKTVPVPPPVLPETPDNGIPPTTPPGTPPPPPPKL